MQYPENKITKRINIFKDFWGTFFSRAWELPGSHFFFILLFFQWKDPINDSKIVLCFFKPCKTENKQTSCTWFKVVSRPWYAGYKMINGEKHSILRKQSLVSQKFNKLKTRLDCNTPQGFPCWMQILYLSGFSLMSHPLSSIRSSVKASCGGSCASLSNRLSTWSTVCQTGRL